MDYFYNISSDNIIPVLNSSGGIDGYVYNGIFGSFNDGDIPMMSNGNFIGI